MYCQKNDKQKGFTLLELVLVVAMIGLIATFSVTLSTGFISRTDLSRAENESVVGLRRAQVLAQMGTDDSDWGVHIEDNQLTLFKGSNFQERDSQIDEEYDLGSVVISAPVDVVYQKLSGRPYESFSEINLRVMEETATITINSEGTISY